MVTYNETETREDTRPLFGRTSSNAVLDNQLDFTQAVPYPNYSSYQSESKEDEDISSSYEVEREYNIEKLPEDEVIVPTFMPTLHQQSEQTKVENDYKIRLNARGKIIASVFGLVACLLIAFVTYNAVVIGNLSNRLDALKVDQVRQTASIGNLETSFQSMTSDASIGAAAANEGLSVRSEADDIIIQLGTRPEIKTAQKTTNWFNDICEFFVELFN